MLPRNSQRVERREPSRLPPGFHIEFRADAPDDLCAVAFRGEHPAQEEQVPGLYCFDIGAEWLRRQRELEGKLLQPLLGARDLGHGSFLLVSVAGPPYINTR